MVGSIIAGGVGLAGQIIGGSQRARAMQRIRDELNNRQRENEDWYNRRYNEDATQRADTQRILQLTEDAIRRRNRAAQGRQAVMGGTDASVESTKEANAQALADSTAQIAVAGEKRKDDIENKYQTRRESLANAMNNLDAQEAEEIAKATKGVSDTFGSIASML